MLRCRRHGSRGLTVLLALLCVFSIAIGVAPAHAEALKRACGTSDGTAREPVASDSLFVLRAAVGIAGSCGHCLCDVNDSGGIGAADALAVLRRAVDGQTPLPCPDCTCRALTLLQTGERPSSVRAIDLDEDGHRDLVTADLQAGEVSIFRGKGRGVFERRRAVAVDETPQTVTIADLDGDGFLDLVTADALPNGLSVRLGGEDGEFGGTDRAFFVPTGIAPINVAAAQLNGDGHLDLVVANSLSDDISVLLGNGDGTFDEEVRTSVGSGPRWVALADIDGDQVLDAVTANRDSNDLSVLTGDGAGGFGSEQKVGVPAGPYHVSLADLDGDGRTDLVAACIGAQGVAVVMASQNQGFEESVFYPTQGSAIATSLALLDADDAIDIVAANYDHGGSPGVTVLLGNGDGTFTVGGYADTDAQPRALVAGDIDEDGKADVVVANADSSTLTVLHGTGDGGLMGALESRASSEAGELIVVDLDEDGLDEVVTTDRHNSVTTGVSDGAGLFERTVHRVNGQPFEVGSGDVNGDGAIDLVGASGPSFVDLTGVPRGDLGKRAFVLFGDGEGAFDLGPASSELASGEEIENSTVIGEVDGDGIPDMAIGVGEILLVRGLSDGSFESFGSLEAAHTFPALALADIDGDGDNDLLELSRAEHVVSIHRNLGGGVFEESQSHDVTATWTLAAHDVAGDGSLDVVTTGANDGTISVLVGDGEGGFVDEVVSSTDVLLQRYAIDDFDGDGNADIATSAEGGLVLLPGDGQGHFGSSAIAGPVFLPTSLALVDVGVGRFETGAPRTVVGVGGIEGAGNRFIVLSHVGDCLVR